MSMMVLNYVLEFLVLFHKFSRKNYLADRSNAELTIFELFPLRELVSN